MHAFFCYDFGKNPQFFFPWSRTVLQRPPAISVGHHAPPSKTSSPTSRPHQTHLSVVLHRHAGRSHPLACLGRTSAGRDRGPVVPPSPAANNGRRANANRPMGRRMVPNRMLLLLLLLLVQIAEISVVFLVVALEAARRRLCSGRWNRRSGPISAAAIVLLLEAGV